MAELSPIKSDQFEDLYDVIRQIGTGAFSKVYKCRNKTTQNYFACKQLDKEYASMEEAKMLSEVRTMLELPHPNILRLHEMFFNPTLGRLSMISELMDTDLCELIKSRGDRNFSERHVKYILLQILNGLAHLHQNRIIHRDVKPENILLKHGNPDVVVLADLGSVLGPGATAPFTQYVSTRWYRAPETMMTAGFYDEKIDVWAAGCIFYELLTFEPLFNGVSASDQLRKIHDILGTPEIHVLHKFHVHKSSDFQWGYDANEEEPGLGERMIYYSYGAKNLLERMVEYDPDLRCRAEDLIEHPFFTEIKNSSTPIGSFVEKMLSEENTVLIHNEQDSAIDKLWDPSSGRSPPTFAPLCRTTASLNVHKLLNPLSPASPPTLAPLARSTAKLNVHKLLKPPSPGCPPTFAPLCRTTGSLNVHKLLKPSPPSSPPTFAPLARSTAKLNVHELLNPPAPTSPPTFAPLASSTAKLNVHKLLNPPSSSIPPTFAPLCRSPASLNVHKLLNSPPPTNPPTFAPLCRTTASLNVHKLLNPPSPSSPPTYAPLRRSTATVNIHKLLNPPSPTNPPTYAPLARSTATLNVQKLRNPPAPTNPPTYAPLARSTAKLNIHDTTKTKRSVSNEEYEKMRINELFEFFKTRSGIPPPSEGLSAVSGDCERKAAVISNEEVSKPHDLKVKEAQGEDMKKYQRESRDE